jgi:hypothetical protein
MTRAETLVFWSVVVDGQFRGYRFENRRLARLSAKSYRDNGRKARACRVVQTTVVTVEK